MEDAFELEAEVGSLFTAVSSSPFTVRGMVNNITRAVVSGSANNEPNKATLDMECFMHLYGIGNPQNMDKARKVCYQSAVEIGDPGSQNITAVFYNEDGNRERAIYWFKKASAKGHTGALEQLKKMGIK